MSDELRAARERLRNDWLITYRRFCCNDGLSSNWMQDVVTIVDNDFAEHPADENETAELGTIYIDGCTRIELRSTGIKTVSIAMQTLGWDWDWVCLRTWEYPAAPTRGDVLRLLFALGIEVSK